MSEPQDIIVARGGGTTYTKPPTTQPTDVQQPTQVISPAPAPAPAPGSPQQVSDVIQMGDKPVVQPSPADTYQPVDIYVGSGPRPAPTPVSDIVGPPASAGMIYIPPIEYQPVDIYQGSGPTPTPATTSAVLVSPSMLNPTPTVDNSVEQAITGHDPTAFTVESQQQFALDQLLKSGLVAKAPASSVKLGSLSPEEGSQYMFTGDLSKLTTEQTDFMKTAGFLSAKSVTVPNPLSDIGASRLYKESAPSGFTPTTGVGSFNLATQGYEFKNLVTVLQAPSLVANRLEAEAGAAKLSGDNWNAGVKFAGAMGISAAEVFGIALVAPEILPEVLGISAISLAGAATIGAGFGEAISLATTGKPLKLEDLTGQAMLGEGFAVASAAVLVGVASAAPTVGRAIVGLGAELGNVGVMDVGSQLPNVAKSMLGRAAINAAVGGGAGYVLSGGDIKSTVEGAALGGAFSLGMEAIGSPLLENLRTKLPDALGGVERLSLGEPTLGAGGEEVNTFVSKPSEKLGGSYLRVVADVSENVVGTNDTTLQSLINEYSGKTIPTGHGTLNAGDFDLSIGGKTLLKAFPEMGKGFRGSQELYPFYSAPGKLGYFEPNFDVISAEGFEELTPLQQRVAVLAAKEGGIVGGSAGMKIQLPEGGFRSPNDIDVDFPIGDVRAPPEKVATFAKEALDVAKNIYSEQGLDIGNLTLKQSGWNRVQVYDTSLNKAIIDVGPNLYASSPLSVGENEVNVRPLSDIYESKQEIVSEARKSPEVVTKAQRDIAAVINAASGEGKMTAGTINVYGGYLGVAGDYSGEARLTFGGKPTVLATLDTYIDPLMLPKPGESTDAYITRFLSESGKTGISPETIGGQSAERQFSTPTAYKRFGVDLPGSLYVSEGEAGVFQVKQLPAGKVGEIPILRDMFSKYTDIRVVLGHYAPVEGTPVAGGLEVGKDIEPVSKILDVGEYNKGYVASESVPTVSVPSIGVLGQFSSPMAHAQSVSKAPVSPVSVAKVASPNRVSAPSYSAPKLASVSVSPISASDVSGSRPTSPSKVSQPSVSQFRSTRSTVVASAPSYPTQSGSKSAGSTYVSPAPSYPSRSGSSKSILSVGVIPVSSSFKSTSKPSTMSYGLSSVGKSPPVLGTSKPPSSSRSQSVSNFSSTSKSSSVSKAPQPPKSSKHILAPTGGKSRQRVKSPLDDLGLYQRRTDLVGVAGLKQRRRRK